MMRRLVALVFDLNVSSCPPLLSFFSSVIPFCLVVQARLYGTIALAHFF